VCFRERDKSVYAVQGNYVCLVYDSLEDICAVRTKWKCVILNLAVRICVLISAFLSRGAKTLLGPKPPHEFSRSRSTTPHPVRILWRRDGPVARTYDVDRAAKIKVARPY
jgi:hypothetical protein